MRKTFKKIATVVASLSMMAAMSVTAFGYDTYQFVGNPNLVGQEDAEYDSKKLGWCTTNEDQCLTPVDGLDGVWSYKGNSVTALDDAEVDDAKRAERRQFKILADGDLMGWSFQCCIGNPDIAWADNQTQFQIDESLELGEFTAYVEPAKGFVCIIQNGKNIDLLCRYHSRDEDSTNYVKLTKADIEADGYSGIAFDDAAYLEFVNKVLEFEGAEKIDSLYGDDASTVTGTDETTADANTTPEETKATEKTEEKEEKEEKDSNTTMIVVIVVVVVVVIAAVAALLLKKKN